MRFLIALFTVLTFSAELFPQVKLDINAPWTTLFEDEFTGYDAIYELLDENYRLDDQRCNTFFELSSRTAEIDQQRGILKLKAVKNAPTCTNGEVLDYTGLGLRYNKISSPPACSWEDARLGFRYGLYEIRCKLPKDKFSASFWMYNGAEEWNVIESTGSDLPTNVHDYQGGLDTPEFPLSDQHPGRRICGVIIPVDRDLTEQFHTYSFMWDYDNRTLTWFFDGREIRTETRMNIFDCNLPFIFGISQGSAYVEEGIFEVDYIRVLGLADTSASYRYQYQGQALPPDTKISPEPDALALGNADWIFYRNSNNSLSSLRKVNGTYVHALITPDDRYSIDGDVAVGSGNRVFYRGADGKLHIVDWNGSGWVHQAIDEADISPQYGGSLATNRSEGGGNHVFFRGPQGWMEHFYKKPGGEWASGPVGGHHDLNYRVGGDIVVGDNGQVFYVGADNRVQLYSWTAAKGWSHYYVDNNWQTDEYKAASGSGALQIAGGTLFYRGLDDRIHRYSFSHTTQAWEHEVLPFEIPEDFVGGEIALPRTSDEEVYFIGRDGYLQHCFLYKGRWLHRWVDERLDNTPEEHTPNGIDLAAWFSEDGKHIVYVRDQHLRLFNTRPMDRGDLVDLPCNTEEDDAEMAIRNTGVKTAGEDQPGRNIKLFPNPVRMEGRLDVRLSMPALPAGPGRSHQTLVLHLYSADGQLVRSKKELLPVLPPHVAVREQVLSFSTAGLPRGVYTLVATFSHSGGREVARLVVL